MNEESNAQKLEEDYQHQKSDLSFHVLQNSDISSSYVFCFSYVENNISYLLFSKDVFHKVNYERNDLAYDWCQTTERTLLVDKVSDFDEYVNTLFPVFDEDLQTFSEYSRNFQQKQQVHEGNKSNHKFPENGQLMPAIFEI